MTKINLPSERQVGHLTLLRQQRDISMKEFALLAADEQLEMIRKTQGKQKYDLLLNSQNAEQLVPQLHPQELYLTINQIGAADSSEILELASTEQITTLLDLDCWDNDQLSSVLSLRWLELLLTTSDDKCCQVIREIEPEIMALFLKKHLTISRGIEAFDDDDCDNSHRLESLYDVDYTSEDAAKVIGALLKLWQEQEQQSYLLIMEMIRSENMSSLEEESFQARSNRLLDLGIMPRHEALSIYSYIDPDQFQSGGKKDYRLEADEMPNPMALMVDATPGNILAELFAGGIDHETACEMVHLVNRKLSADRADLSSAQELSQSLQNLYDVLNLALEFLAGKDLQRAQDIFDSTYLLHLFQLGHSLIIQRQKRAEKLQKSIFYHYTDYPELLFIDSLLEQPALFYRAPDEDHPSHIKAIATVKDLELADKRLQQVEALEHLFSHQLPFQLPQIEADEEPETTLAGIFMTAVANRLLGRDFLPTPLQVEDVPVLAEKTLSGSELKPEFVDDFFRLFSDLAPECNFFASYCLDLWDDFFSAAVFDTTPEQGECFLLLED